VTATALLRPFHARVKNQPTPTLPPGITETSVFILMDVVCTSTDSPHAGLPPLGPTQRYIDRIHRPPGPLTSGLHTVCWKSQQDFEPLRELACRIKSPAHRGKGPPREYAIAIDATTSMASPVIPRASRPRLVRTPALDVVSRSPDKPALSGCLHYLPMKFDRDPGGSH